MPAAKWISSHAREEYVGEEGIIGYRGINAAGRYWRNHMPAIEIREKIGESIWNSYFKFCVVRNPFDKLVSGFFFFEAEKRNGQELINSFREWIKKGERTLIDGDKYQINGKICMDYFIRYKNLADGIEHVCKVLEIPFEPERIPKLKMGYRDKRIPVRNFYNKETIEIIESRFNFELDYFQYSMPE